MASKELDPEKIKADLVRSQLIMGAGLAGALALIVAGTTLLLPKEYRMCSLMPGFCQTKKEKKSRDAFEELGKGNAKFDLTSGFSIR